MRFVCLYTADAENWMNYIIPPQKGILFELDQARDQEKPITVGGCPVNAIRKVNNDGTDLFIGAIDITRNSDFGEVVRTEHGDYIVDQSKKEENERLNLEREVGDPEILWDFGGERDCNVGLSYPARRS